MGRWSLIITLALLAAALTLEYKRLTMKPWPAQHFSAIEDHFKYGSIGAEVDGYPYRVWRELPHIFADRIPAGYAQFGFITEPGRELPVGVSVRRYGVQRVGFNCGTCHTSTYSYEGARQMVYGAPAHRLDLQAYLSFISEATNDPRLTADAVVQSAREQGRPFNFVDEFIFRRLIFPRLKSEARALETSFAWMQRRPPHGPGRTDAGNFWRARWGMHPERDDATGVVDHPSVWNQQARRVGWFHWDGNNRSLDERNISAALAGGASDWLLERHNIGRVSDWLTELDPPRFPGPIDAALAAEGRGVFVEAGCAACHDPGAAKMGQVTPIEVLGTDPERTALFDDGMVDRFADVGAAYSWRFTNYRSTNGYVNMPLDGIWMRSPYLHNGSVPSLRALLTPAADRPQQFYRGCDRLDPDAVGFVCASGFLFDTRLRGNGNGGHEYGTGLPADQQQALLEYLKSL